MDSFRNIRKGIAKTPWSVWRRAFILITSGGPCMILWINWKVQRRVASTEHYGEAMAILDEHVDARQLLGEPVVIGRVDLLDRKQNYIGPKESRFLVPLCGQHNSGFLSILANRQSEQEKYSTQRLELKMDGGENYLLFERPEKTEESKEEEVNGARARAKRPRGR